MVGLKKIEVYGLIKEAEFYQAKVIAEVGINLTKNPAFQQSNNYLQVKTCSDSINLLSFGWTMGPALYAPPVFGPLSGSRKDRIK